MEFNPTKFEVGSLSTFIEAMTADAKASDSNDFFVNAVATEKSFYLPYLKIGQGTRFSMANMTGDFVARVEKPVKGLNVKIVGDGPYLTFGKEFRATVVGMSKSKMHTESKTKFIPMDKDTVIPADWNGKLITVYHIALYTGNALVLLEGIKTKRRVTDKIVEEIMKRPSYYNVVLVGDLDKGKEGEFIAPKLVSIEPAKGNSEIENVKIFAREYFNYRLQKTKETLQKKLQVVTVKEEDIPQTVQAPGKVSKPVNTNDDGFETDDDEEIPF